MNRTTTLRWLLAAVLWAGVAQAQTLNPAVEATLTREYGRVPWELVRDRAVNGMTLSEFRIHEELGESTTLVAENGDIVFSSRPFAFAKLPQTIVDQFSSSFRTIPQLIQRITLTEYLVDVGGAKPCRARLDPSGRVREIISGLPLRQQQAPERDCERAAQGDLDRLATAIAQKAPRARVLQAYRIPGAEDWFLLKLASVVRNDAADMEMIVSPGSKDVAHWRIDVARADVPQGLLESLNTMFRQPEILRIQKNTSVVYQIDMVNGEEDVLVQFRPTGELIGAHSLLGRASDDAIDGRYRYGHGADHPTVLPPFTPFRPLEQ